MDFKTEYRQYFINQFTLLFFQTFATIVNRKPLTPEVKSVDSDFFFILGSGRCGSTLLRSILTTSKNIHIPPESSALPNMIKKYIRYQGLDWKDLSMVILGEFISNPAFEYWDIELDVLIKNIQNLSKEDHNLQGLILTIYHQHLLQNKERATLVGDKTTFNTLRLNLITRVFPNAKYINLVRDGRDVLTSYLKSNLESDVKLITWKWNKSVERVKDFSENNRYQKNVLTIKYEDLVKSPQKMSNIITDFLETPAINIANRAFSIPNDDLILEHHHNVRNQISENSIGKWKTELSTNDIKYANHHMKKNLISLGYSL